MEFKKGKPYCQECKMKYLVRKELTRIMLRCQCGCLILYREGNFSYISKEKYDPEFNKKTFEEKDKLYYRKLVKDYSKAIEDV